MDSFITDIIKSHLKVNIKDIVFLDTIKGKNLKLYALEFIDTFGTPYRVIVIYNELGMFVSEKGFDRYFTGITNQIIKLEDYGKFVKKVDTYKEFLKNYDTRFEFLLMGIMFQFESKFGKENISLDRFTIRVRINNSILSINAFSDTVLDSRFAQYKDILSDIKGVNIIWV